MRPLDESLLRQIAEGYGIDYDVAPSIEGGEKAIKTRMARRFPETRERLFERIADIEDHVRLFSHLKALKCIYPRDIANVIGDNQLIIVEGLAEGGSKLGVKLITKHRPERIDCELFTDLFKTVVRAGPSLRDSKVGAIHWEFHEVDKHSCVMQVRSSFEVGEKTAYVRGMIDHVWLDFFENVMIDVGELQPEQKKCDPVPDGIKKWSKVA